MRVVARVSLAKEHISVYIPFDVANRVLRVAQQRNVSLSCRASVNPEDFLF